MIITLTTKEIELQLLDYGATIYKLKTKDINNNFENIVLTHNKEEDYYNGNPSYFGATCGRYAGRIKNGEFEIEGTTYKVSRNFKDTHTLHGGFENLSKVFWDYEISNIEEKSICTFTYKSKDLEEGFPGNIEVKVEYVLEKNTLLINYYATSDKKTYLNLTNHSYFNLGKEETINNHILQLDSSNFIHCDSDQIPVNIASVNNIENKDFDFRTSKAFGDLKNKNNKTLKELNGYDNVFILDKKNEYDLSLEDKSTGRSLKLKTSYPCCVIYTYNSKHREDLFNRENKEHVGVAIEAQYAPNAMNSDLFTIPVIDKNKPYKEYIKYTFN